MKLIAEIQTEKGDPLFVSCEGETLTIGGFSVPLDEFRKALDAVAPKQTPPLSVMGSSVPVIYRDGINPYSSAVTAAPTRAPDGTRIGPSPRESMRARPAPEANVVDEQETAA